MINKYDSESSGRKHPILFACGHGVCNECCEEILDQYEALECPFCRSNSVNRVKNSFNSLSEVACFLSKSFWCYNLFEQRHSLCLDRNMWVDSRILKRSKLLNAVVKTFHIHRSFQLIYWVIPIDSESM